jgi:phosphate transport system substrate-binding protein
MRASRAAFFLLLGIAAAATAQENVRVRSSAIAFERLSPLRDALARYCPQLVVEWSQEDADGAVAALLAGAADLAIVFRELDGFEAELAARLEVALREHVLALDGASVIVHPDNPLPSLTLGQLERLMSGKVVGWHGVGGPDIQVRLVEEGPTIASSVASDRGAIGLVSMGVDRSSVKTVPVQADESSPPVAPTPESVESGEYPLSRPIRVYSRDVAVEPVREVLSFMLLSEGQAAVARSGFVALPADRAIQRDPPARGTPEAAPVVRVSFPTGGSSIEVRASLDRIAERALAGGNEVWITGPSARAAGSYLQGRGVTVSRIEVLRSAEDGRDVRRADVWLLPRR